MKCEIEIEIEQCFTSPPTQYRLYGRRFLQVKRPNQQYHSTEGGSCKGKQESRAAARKPRDAASVLFG